ncbi:DUF2399 domain-containing protein [Saccharopolyspora griseoalba]|uniref:DUF2399 domain-containing protein n=1 Tax=Saccharopolyspora griseoalba TaxID=1431848 RepID=A0ABW2LMF7_9PSEU
MRAVLHEPALQGLWAAAREALASPKQPPTFRLELPDDAARAAVGELYGRPMWGQGTRISVSKLDAAMRERFGTGLAEALRAEASEPAATDESDAAEVLRRALDDQGLADEPWAQPWIAWVLRYGRVAAEDLPVVARRSARVLAAMTLHGMPRIWTSRGELAALTGDPHLLDEGSTPSRIVLKAASLAHDQAGPGNERERRALWERCGVAPDGVADTTLTWALPLSGDDAWSAGIRQRTELGLPAHLTHLDLRAAPPRLVEPDTAIAICEHPRVLEAAIREGIRHPMLCLAGPPTTATRALLGRLISDGASLHHHADFDWRGISAANAVQQFGAEPWRMSAADYRSAVDRAAAQRVDLPNLVGSPVPTPWDPALADLMSTAARAVEEEQLLPQLLSDLRTGL